MTLDIDEAHLIRSNEMDGGYKLISQTIHLLTVNSFTCMLNLVLDLVSDKKID